MIPAKALAFANTAVSYCGLVPYVYGGFNPTRGWDCSGFVGYLLSVHYKLTLPGMFKGQGHRAANELWSPSLGWHPAPADAYLDYRYAKTITHSEARPGDLYVWQTHIAVALGPDFMMSAFDVAKGTTVTPVVGFGPVGETLVTRRLTPLQG